MRQLDHLPNFDQLLFQVLLEQKYKMWNLNNQNHFRIFSPKFLKFIIWGWYIKLIKIRLMLYLIFL